MTARHPLTLAVAIASAAALSPAWAHGAASQDNVSTLDTLTVTSAATKTETPFNETPQATTRVERDEWEEKGAESVQRALNYSAGAYTNQIGASNRYDYIVLRGFSDGSLSNNQVFANMASAEPGVPDGMKVDTLGRVFCTGSGGIWVFDPDGTRLGVIRGPEVPRNMAFGGPDFRTVYTTPGDSLYSFRVKTPGIRPY